jgi:hypothetical protein
MYAQPVDNEDGAPLPGATADQSSQRSLRWARIRELAVAIGACGDPAQITEQARELVEVLRELEEWDCRPAGVRPIPHVALNDHQVALTYSLVLLALVQKTGSTVDRPGEPRYIDVLDRWLQATADELEEVRARLAEVWGSRVEGVDSACE